MQILYDRTLSSDMQSYLTPAQVARVAFVVAFASTVDAFRPVSLGTFTPSLRTTGVTMRNDIMLRKPSASSKSLLGLRASASNPFTESLEKAYNEPSATFSRERMYELAQVNFCSRYALLNLSLNNWFSSAEKLQRVE